MTIFSYIKQKVNILDVVSDHVDIKKNGSYWGASCPFHDEKTESFTVSPHKEVFYCFGCHKGGDVISFIANIKDCSQLEAAEYLYKVYDIELPVELSGNIKDLMETKKKK
jgi:DNA primase